MAPDIEVEAEDEPEFLTVKELAALLRLKERKVYDLAASGAVPCSRATGKLLFPAAQIRQWIAGATSGGQDMGTVRPAIVLGSHDPLLDWAIRESRCGLATFFDGSLDGLARYEQGEGLAAGLHLYDAPSRRWNVPAVAQRAAGLNAALVLFAVRRRGLVSRADGPRPRTLADLEGVRLAPRQPESGTAILFEQLARDAGLDLAALDLADVARTEDDAVEAVRLGEADATIGLESVANSYGLPFSPLIEEEFCLLVDRRAWFEAPMQGLLAFCKSDKFSARAEALGGYDVSRLGEVVWNA